MLTLTIFPPLVGVPLSDNLAVAIPTVALLGLAYVAARLPASWIAHGHRQRIEAKYYLCRAQADLLLASWNGGDRCKAFGHLSVIRQIERDIRLEISNGCRFALACWSVACSAVAMSVIYWPSVGLRLLPNGHEMPWPIGNLAIAMYVLIALSAHWSFLALFRDLKLPQGVLRTGDFWAACINERLEEDRARELQAKADAEEAARVDKRQREEAEKFDRFRHQQSARDRARAEEEAERLRRAEQRFYEEYRAQKQRELPAEVRSSIDLLKVQVDYTLEDINTARRTAVKKLHPDVSQKVTPRTRSRREERLKAVNHAYDVLKKRVT